MRVRAWCDEIVRDYDVRTTAIDAPAASLSGGNQQKVVVARVMSGDPRVIIAVSPTRGLDLRATQYVRDVLRSARDQGAFVVLFTTDLDELAQLADRALIMSSGRLLEGQEIGLLLGGVE
jgi:simple sugar transport system ATP-binding protein